MKDKRSLAIQMRMAKFLRSEEFDKYFHRMHIDATLAWVVVIIAAWTVIGIPFTIGIWKKILKGDLGTKKLRKRYAELGKKGEIIFTYVAVANVSLMAPGDSDAPALVLGNFEENVAPGLAAVIERCAEASLGIPQAGDEPLQKLLGGNLEYTFMRRREVPPQFTDGIPLMAFDLQILREFLPGGVLMIEAIPCIAEPGPKGLTCMIPTWILQEVFDEMREFEGGGEGT